MKAAMWYKKGDVRIVDIPEPDVVPNSVKIKVKWCGICGTDLHEYLAGPIFIPTEEAPHPISGGAAPVVLGHEFSGVVTEVGEGTTRLAVGDRVCVEPMVVCGRCPACEEGLYNLCSSLGFHGLCGTGGGLAEYTVFPEKFVHKIPDSMSYEKAALVEPITVGYHAVHQAGFQLGQTALVCGAGPIGIAMIENLRAAGASKVFCIQRKSIRQRYAKEAGADYVLDPGEVDPVEEIRRLTDGYGVNAAFECATAENCLNYAIEAVRYNGTVVVASIWEGPAAFSPNAIVFTEKKIVGSIVYRRDFPTVIQLMDQGRIKADNYCTKKIELVDLVEEGFGTLTGPDKKAQLKILVTPDKSLLG